MPVFPSVMSVFPSVMPLFGNDMSAFASNMSVFPSVCLYFPAICLCFPAIFLCFPAICLCFPAICLCFPVCLPVICHVLLFAVDQSQARHVGSISDYDPMNEKYGSITGQPSDTRRCNHINHYRRSECICERFIFVNIFNWDFIAREKQSIMMKTYEGTCHIHTLIRSQIPVVIFENLSSEIYPN